LHVPWPRLFRRKGPLAVFSGVVAVSMMALAGCGSSSTAANSTSHPNALTIAMGAQSQPNWWAPVVPATSCGTLSGGMGGSMWQYMPLLWISSQDTIDYSQSIAQSITHNAAGTVYTIQLKHTWQWSNGTPITAQDVVYDFELDAAASASNSPFPYCFAGEGGMPTMWKSVQATGPYTVQITTSKPVNANWFELNGIAQLVPVPKQQWDRYSNMTQELNWIKSIANEPTNPIYQVTDAAYLIKKAVSDQYYEFVANPKFSGSPKPHIKTVVYDYETSTASIFAALKKGTVQMAPYSDSLWGSRNQLKNYTIYSEPLFGFFYLPINFASDAPDVSELSQLYFRQALQYGIDQNGIVSAIYHGLAHPTYGPAPTIDDAYYDKAMGNLYPYDPAKGRKLLEEHGWKMGPGGYFEKNGHVAGFTLLYSTGSTTFNDEAQLLKADWAKEGIDVTLEAIGGNAFGGIVGNPAESSKWSVAGGFGWIYVPDYYPTGDGLFNGPGGFNVGAYNDPHENQLVAETLAPSSPAETQKIFDEYQYYTFQQLPVLYVPTPTGLTAVSNQLGGFQQNYNVVFAETNAQDLYWK
jgi:peptide/nickel transport system substrate-binding protein